VVKGGHATIDDAGDAVDVVCDGRTITELRAPRIASANTHGSGCSFAAAIAAGLAQGRCVADAIRDAKSFVHRAIATAATWQLGAGPGPLDHFRWNDEEEL
jgi:hydroxymethylpyrimidine kinase/phosphomethylpyrimidine kinase